MSLLLKALQNAAKNREAAVAGAQPNPQPASETQETTATAAGSELTLEPVQAGPRTQPAPPPQSTPRTPPSYGRAQPAVDDAGERAAPSPLQAQNVLRAATPPQRPGILQWLAQRPLVAFSTAAGLFAIGYGVYLYLQITNPGVFTARRPPPAPPALAQVPVPVQPPAAPPASISAQPPLPPGAVPPPADPAAAATSATPAAPGTAPIAGLPGPGTPQAAAPASPSPGAAPATASVAATAAPTATMPSGPAVAAARPNDPVASSGAVAAPAASAPAARPAARPRASAAARRDPAESAAPTAAASQIVPVDANLASAYQALEKGQLNDAERLYRQALASNPSSVDTMLGLASTLAQQNRGDVATQFYMRVLEQEPGNSYAQAGLLALGGRADPVAAETRLKQLIARDPSAFLYFTLGNLYSEQGQWAAAQSAYFQAHNRAPDNPDYAFNLAVGLEHLSQPRIALDYYRRALALAQTRGNAQFDPARVQSRIRSLETALAERP